MNLKGYYNELQKVSKLFKTKEESFFIYKGFRLSKSITEVYTLQDVRFSDLYTPLSVVDYLFILDNGFVKGVDIINYKSNLEKLKNINTLINKFLKKRKSAKERLDKNTSTNIRLDKKRVRLANTNIDNLIDREFILEERIRQFNNKYKYEFNDTVE